MRTHHAYLVSGFGAAGAAGAPTQGLALLRRRLQASGCSGTLLCDGERVLHALTGSFACLTGYLGALMACVPVESVTVLCVLPAAGPAEPAGADGADGSAEAAGAAGPRDCTVGYVDSAQIDAVLAAAAAAPAPALRRAFAEAAAGADSV